MNRTTQQDATKWRALRDKLARNDDPREMLDVLLAVDQMLVEYSMRVYNVPHRDRHLMRKHHRRLHNAVREHLPRLLQGEGSRSSRST